MKIIIIGPAHPYRGGIAKFNEVLAENFSRAGNDVLILNFTMQYPSFLFPGKTQYTDTAAPALNIRRVINSVNPFSWLGARRMLRREKPDLVVVRYWMPFFAPALGSIVRGAECPVIALTDNIVPHEKHFYDTPCTKYFLGGVDGVIYMSSEVGRTLEHFNYKGVSAFSPHPLYDTYGESVPREEALEKLNLDPTKRYALFFGFIRDYKGLDLLLEAFNKLNNKDLRLIVAGEYYGNREKYESLICALGERVVVFDNYIPEEEVRLYFSAADIVVQPYKSATQSGVTQVAYHFNKPMIVTRVGGLPEIVPDGKVGYVVGCDSTEIAAAIEDFYDNSRSEEFLEHILQEKKRFEWSAMVETFMDIFRKIN